MGPPVMLLPVFPPPPRPFPLTSRPTASSHSFTLSAENEKESCGRTVRIFSILQITLKHEKAEPQLEQDLCCRPERWVWIWFCSWLLDSEHEVVVHLCTLHTVMCDTYYCSSHCFKHTLKDKSVDVLYLLYCLKSLEQTQTVNVYSTLSPMRRLWKGQQQQVHLNAVCLCKNCAN